MERAKMSLMTLVSGGVGFFAGVGLGDVLGLGDLFEQVMTQTKIPITIAGTTVAALMYLGAIPGIVWKYVKATGYEFIKYGLVGLSIGIGISLLGVF